MATKIKEYPSLIENLTHNVSFATDEEINAALVTKYRNYVYLYLLDEDNSACLQAVIDEWGPYCDKLYATTQYEYDPIENYNRHEEYNGKDRTTYGRKDATETNIKEARETDIKNEHSVDSKSAVNAGMKTEHARDETRTPNTEDITVHSDSGYDNPVGSESSRDVLTRRGTENINSPALANYDETTGDEDDNYTHNSALPADNYDRAVGEKTKNYTETTGDKTHNYTQRSGTDLSEDEHTLDAHGNIGTMSTQSLIQLEREIIVNVLAFYMEKFSKCFNITADGLYAEFEHDLW